MLSVSSPSLTCRAELWTLSLRSLSIQTRRARWHALQVEERTGEIPQLLSDVQVPQVLVVAETVEISQLQAAEKIAETPETHTIQGIQTTQSLDTAPVRQVSQAGVVEVNPTR